MCLYLPEGTLADQYTTSSGVLLEKLQYWHDRESVKDAVDLDGVDYRIDLHEFVSLTVERRRITWSRICESMARLRIDVAKEP
jgi:hypothetical protein